MNLRIAKNQTFSRSRQTYVFTTLEKPAVRNCIFNPIGQNGRSTRALLSPSLLAERETPWDSNRVNIFTDTEPLTGFAHVRCLYPLVFFSHVQEQVFLLRHGTAHIDEKRRSRGHPRNTSRANFSSMLFPFCRPPPGDISFSLSSSLLRDLNRHFLRCFFRPEARRPPRSCNRRAYHHPYICPRCLMHHVVRPY